MKTPIQLLSEHTGVAESTLQIHGALMPVQGALEFAQKIIEQSEQNKMLLMAEHQLTGFNHASQGYSIEDLARAMCLTEEEWTTIKDKGADWCPTNLVKDLDQYFENKHNEIP